MGILEYFDLVVSDYTLRTITMGTAALGAICGMLGSFAVLRKQSLLGDAISHAALPGIAIAFLITQTKDNNMLLLGALVSGLIGAYWVRGIVTRTHLKSDAALGIILSVFFGFGMLLLTYIQKQPNANQAGLDKYLFGQAATLVTKDVRMLVYVLGGSLFLLLLFWKELKVMLFDPEYTLTLGFNIKFLDLLITFCIVVAIVLGLQTVGVVLMSAMLLAPAAAARQWTDKLWVMLFLAAIFGIIAGVFGTAISATGSNLSTGPVIVLIAVGIVLVSFVFSPTRGLLMRQFKFSQNKKSWKQKKILLDLYDLDKGTALVKSQEERKDFPVKAMKTLSEKGLVKMDENAWKLTSKGIIEAESANL